MYETILVATDGSGPANRAVTTALEHADQFDADVHAIYVVDTDRYAEPALGSSELATNQMEEWGSEQLEEVKNRAVSSDVSVITRCCHGKPHIEIINYADDIDADLVVLGYQGHSHTVTNQIGSVTNRVVQNVGRQVLVV